MGLFPYVSFTRFLRDGSREGLGYYIEAVASAIAAWEGIDIAALEFQPSDPPQGWCPPSGDLRRIDCRVPASDPVRRWSLLLFRKAAPRVLGALYADDPSEHLAQSYDWRGYGDHLILSGVSDTARNLGDAAPEVRGFASGILLETRLEALSRRLPSSLSAVEVAPYAALIRAVEEALCAGSGQPEILGVSERRREMRRFLAQQDVDLLERIGEGKLAQLLDPLGMTFKQWRKARVG